MSTWFALCFAVKRRCLELAATSSLGNVRWISLSLQNMHSLIRLTVVWLVFAIRKEIFRPQGRRYFCSENVPAPLRVCRGVPRQARCVSRGWHRSAGNAKRVLLLAGRYKTLSTLDCTCTSCHKVRRTHSLHSRHGFLVDCMKFLLLVFAVGRA
jgi:hypothetical protein